MSWYITYTIIYFLIMFAFGFYYYTKVKTSDNYLIANWSMGFWSITGTMISTACGAAVFIGWVGMGFNVGIAGYFQFAFPAMIITLLLFYFFASPLRRQKLYTIADLFSERFGKQAGIIPSVLSAIIYSVPTLALQIVGMTTVFTIAFGLNDSTGMLLGFAMVLGFTILGGLPATIITDALQSIILVVGITTLFVSSIFYGGGIGNVLSETPAEYLTPLGNVGLSGVLLFALSVGPFYLVWQSTWQRIFASKDEKVAKKAGVTSVLIILLISILPYSIGVMARQYVPNDLNPDLIFSYVTVELLHPAIGGIILVGLLAALMTGATSFILQGSSNLTRDMYQRLFDPNASEKRLMTASRLSVVIISILGLIVAFNMSDIITTYEWALRIIGATLVIPFLAAMFWRGVTKKGVLASMVAAMIGTILHPFLNIPIEHTIFGLGLSLITLVVISLLSEHSDEEQVKALYWEVLQSNSRGEEEKNEPISKVK
ncbi:sodium:solute symporter family protein [Alteribacillus bidgolensis]|uniref:Solute:Na+ symporter, SSS family n=1 Tax=Alteribacillus bidgolensis TaxID=930129 RepID=A0A1G8H5X6_9BACI|nr:sodium:solute symporter family protein [Alteribacillus bidgolensis]SDI02064.1 solute:Na+ symporter, SSS family [Alteribacillus bidgolensis]